MSYLNVVLLISLYDALRGCTNNYYTVPGSTQTSILNIQIHIVSTGSLINNQHDQHINTHH